MAECRFYGECRLAGGLSPRQCDGKGMITTLSAVGYVNDRCTRFSPMPNRDKLLALADEMDLATDGCHDYERAPLSAQEVWAYTRRIR